MEPITNERHCWFSAGVQEAADGYIANVPSADLLDLTTPLDMDQSQESSLVLEQYVLSATSTFRLVLVR